MYLNFEKVQSDYLKECIKNNTSWFSGEDENDAFISDGHFISIIPKKICFVKTGCKTQIILEKELVERFKKDSKDSQAVTDTLTECILSDGRKAHIFANESNEILIDTKYIKYFSKMECSYRSTNGKGNEPVYVFVYDKLVGVILPIRRYETKKQGEALETYKFHRRIIKNERVERHNRVNDK